MGLQGTNRWYAGIKPCKVAFWLGCTKYQSYQIPKCDFEFFGEALVLNLLSLILITIFIYFGNKENTCWRLFFLNYSPTYIWKDYVITFYKRVYEKKITYLSVIFAYKFSDLTEAPA